MIFDGLLNILFDKLLLGIILKHRVELPSLREDFIFILGIWDN